MYAKHEQFDVMLCICFQYLCVHVKMDLIEYMSITKSKNIDKNIVNIEKSI